MHGGRIRLLPPEINWAHRMLSQSSASSLLCWSCTHWLKCVASVISNVPLMGSHSEGGELGFNYSTTISSAPARVFDMVAESTVSSRHQRSPCCDIPTIGQLHMWRYTARAQARKFTARPRWAVALTMGGAAPRRGNMRARRV